MFLGAHLSTRGHRREHGGARLCRRLGLANCWHRTCPWWVDVPSHRRSTWGSFPNLLNYAKRMTNKWIVFVCMLPLSLSPSLISCSGSVALWLLCLQQSRSQWLCAGELFITMLILIHVFLHINNLRPKSCNLDGCNHAGNRLCTGNGNELQLIALLVVVAFLSSSLSWSSSALCCDPPWECTTHITRICLGQIIGQDSAHTSELTHSTMKGTSGNRQTNLTITCTHTQLVGTLIFSSFGANTH